MEIRVLRGSKQPFGSTVTEREVEGCGGSSHGGSEAVYRRCFPFSDKLFHEMYAGERQRLYSGYNLFVNIGRVGDIWR